MLTELLKLNTVTLAIIAIIALQCIDFVTTYLLISRGGRELNPLVRTLMEEIGLVPALVISKSFVAVLTAGTLGFTEANEASWIILVLAFAIVAAWNLAQLWIYWSRNRK